MLLLLLFPIKNCKALVSYRSCTDNNKVLAAVRESWSDPVLAGRFLEAQGDCLGALRCRHLLLLLGAWDWVHLQCRWWTVLQKDELNGNRHSLEVLPESTL